jgi:hypothetical protein
LVSAVHSGRHRQLDDVVAHDVGDPEAERRREPAVGAVGRPQQEEAQRQQAQARGDEHDQAHAAGLHPPPARVHRLQHRRRAEVQLRQAPRHAVADDAQQQLRIGLRQRPLGQLEQQRKHVVRRRIAHRPAVGDLHAVDVDQQVPARFRHVDREALVRTLRQGRLDRVPAALQRGSGRRRLDSRDLDRRPAAIRARRHAIAGVEQLPRAAHAKVIGQGWRPVDEHQQREERQRGDDHGDEPRQPTPLRRHDRAARRAVRDRGCSWTRAPCACAHALAAGRTVN